MFGCGKINRFVDATEMLHEVDRVLKMIDEGSLVRGKDEVR